MIKTETKSSGHDGSVCLTRLQRFPDAEAPPPQRFPALKLRPPSVFPNAEAPPPHKQTSRPDAKGLTSETTNCQCAHTKRCSSQSSGSFQSNDDEKLHDSRRRATGRRKSVFVTSSTRSDRNITAKRRN